MSGARAMAQSSNCCTSTDLSSLEPMGKARVTGMRVSPNTGGPKTGRSLKLPGHLPSRINVLWLQGETLCPKNKIAFEMTHSLTAKPGSLSPIPGLHRLSSDIHTGHGTRVHVRVFVTHTHTHRHTIKGVERREERRGGEERGEGRGGLGGAHLSSTVTTNQRL